jgi:hypothetical protein
MHQYRALLSYKPAGMTQACVILCRDRLATYSKPDQKREFSKVWELTDTSRVGPIKLKSFNILGLKQHHSLWALIRGQTEDVDLVSAFLNCWWCTCT